MKPLLILLSLQFFFTPGKAQPASHFNVINYTTENGLPSNGIKGLQWDEKTGFLWMATEAGVVRFNGIDFKYYTKESTDVITAERIQFLIRNRQGAIYACDQVGNIIFIKENKLLLKKKLNRESKTLGASTYTITVSDTFFNYKQLNPGIQPFTIQFDKFLPISDTSLLIIKNNSVFYNTLSNREPLQLDLKGLTITNGFIMEKKCFLVTNNKEFFLFDPSSKQLSAIPLVASSADLIKIKNDKASILWNTGLNNPVLLFENTAWQLLYDGTKIIANEICDAIPTGILFQYAQYSKEKKILFLGTNSKGLLVISAKKVQPLKNQESKGNERNAYYSQIELPDGNILTNEGHILGIHPVSKENLPIKEKFGFNISKTGDSLIWYSQYDTDANFNALHSYNLISRITKKYLNIKAANHFVINSKIKKTIIVNEIGIGELQSDSLKYLHFFTPNILNSPPADIIEMEPGIIAVAIPDGILSLNTSTLKLDTLIEEKNFYARTLFRYKDYLFVGTYGRGYYIIKNSKVKSMPLDKNKFLLYTHCFMPDNMGFCWISTNRGLFKVKLTEIINAFENNISTIYYHYLGKNDGMDITEMNGGCTPCAITLKNGTLSFPTMDGLLWVSPEKTNPILPLGEIYIDEVWVDNKKMAVDSMAIKNLHFKTKEIQFHLGFSAWCNKENIYIDYKLIDEDNWIPLNTNNGAVIQFNNLPQGKYVLQIRKLNGFGINNYTYREISFFIKTPWYKKWWFYGLCLMLIIGFIALYFNYRTSLFKLRQIKLETQVQEKTKELLQKNKVLEKSNSINTRLISIISHDIITPLKFLTVAGKSLQEKRSQMPEELQQETISEITNTAQELQLLSTNILNWIKYQNENRRLMKENFNLHELVQQVLGILQTLARQKKLTIVNKVSEDVIIYQYFEPLKIMIYNLLTNAIHFTELGKIEVNAYTTTENVTITVKDEGIGMSPEKIKSLLADQVVISSANQDNKKGHGLGYLIIKDLMKTMGATLHIESKIGEGSKVSISFSIHKNGVN